MTLLGVIRIGEAETPSLSLVLGAANEWGETKGPVILCAPDYLLDQVQSMGMAELFVDLIPDPLVDLEGSVDIEWKEWSGTLTEQIQEAIERKSETKGLY